MSAETKAALDNAIRAHAADEWDGDYPVDWVLVAGLISTDGEHGVGVEASRDPMPNYVTVGLLSEGMRVTDPEDGDDS